MDVHHGLICFLLLSLRDGNPGFISAQTFFYTVPEGGHVELGCPSSSASSRKFFCKEPCRLKDILIETEAISAQSGRFSIEWRSRGESSSGDVFVNISQLTKSDSGWYRCAVGPSLSSAQYRFFEIIVVDALLDGDTSETRTIYARDTGNIIVACYFSFSLFPVTDAFLCREDCLFLTIERTDDKLQTGRYTIRYVKLLSEPRFVFVSISQLTKSDSGRYSCGLKRNLVLDLERTFELNVTDEPTFAKPNTETSPSVPLSTTPSNNAASPETTEQSGTSTKGVLLYVGVTLVALVVLLALALLIFYRRKLSKPKEPPEETEYASISEARYTKPNGIEIKSDDSSIPGSTTQCAAEDDSSKLTYSELNFSDHTVRSPNSAPSGHADSVIYSTPR